MAINIRSLKEGNISLLYTGTVRYGTRKWFFYMLLSFLKKKFFSAVFTSAVSFYFILFLFLYFSLSLYTCICLYICPHSRLLSPTIYLFHIIFLSLTLIASLCFFSALPSLSFYLFLLSVPTVFPISFLPLILLTCPRPPTRTYSNILNSIKLLVDQAIRMEVENLIECRAEFEMVRGDFLGTCSTLSYLLCYSYSLCCTCLLCYTVLNRNGLCCTVLFWIVMYCAVLYCVVSLSNVLYTELYCIALYCIVLNCFIFTFFYP